MDPQDAMMTEKSNLENPPKLMIHSLPKALDGILLNYKKYRVEYTLVSVLEFAAYVAPTEYWRCT